jgi:hypothetical protein
LLLWHKVLNQENNNYFVMLHSLLSRLQNDWNYAQLGLHAENLFNKNQ